jgi:D-alanyl-lipoteichoic acid acyltransferase DltB (MBOAT superfamily)
MLFNSPQFLLCFLPAVLLGFAVLSRLGRSAVVSFLSLASLVFYAYWRPAFLPLLLGSIAVNFVCSQLIWRYRERPRLQKAVLLSGIVANLGTLAYFKYLFPFLHFVNDTLGLQATIGNVILPLGISFFTFTQIGYLIDLAQDEAQPQDLISYTLFVTFFPHLIAGPIIHHREIMPQFAAGRDFRLKWNDLALGLTWFVLGLCKKVLIADHLAPYADGVFAHTAGLGFADAWLGTLNYSLQLYFDFSGYSDMAVGLARMFSITLPLNFDSPYKAGSVIEFWSRWHMTLTRYLTLYVYNPFSMWINRRRASAGRPNSRKASRTLSGFVEMVALPTMTTMFVAGVWHGAGFQFLVFGVLHGLYLTLNHAWRIFRKDGAVLTRIVNWHPVSVALTFLAVLVGQVFFRAASTPDALTLLGGLCGFNGAVGPTHPLHSWHAYLVFLLFPVVWLCPNTQEILGQAKARAAVFFGSGFTEWQPNWAWAGGIGAMLVAVLWYLTEPSTFLYFQF